MEIALDFVLRTDRTRVGKDASLKTFEDTFAKHASPTLFPSRTTSSQAAPSLPTNFSSTRSPRLTSLLKHLCPPHTHLSLLRWSFQYCKRLLKHDQSLLGEEVGEKMDIDDIGRAGNLPVQEWEEAVRVLEGAWERGREEDVSRIFWLLSFISIRG
jgi:hypothetical protein